MDNIWDIYQSILFIVDKARNGYVSPEDVSRALDMSQQAIFQKYVALLREGSQMADEALIPFNKKVVVASDPSGLISYPNDFGFLTQLYKPTNGEYIIVEQMLHSELEYYTGSVLDPVSLFKPKCVVEGTGIQLYPRKPNTVELHYLSRPQQPVIGYTVTGNEAIYDPGASTQLEFNPNYWTEILQGALAYVGLNLKDQQLVNGNQSNN